MKRRIPELIPNFIDGIEAPSLGGETYAKIDPATGRSPWRVARSRAPDVRAAVRAAAAVQESWARTSVVRRADLLRELALSLHTNREWIARVVAAETGKSVKEALGEASAAFEMGLFMAGEGRRYYGRTSTSGIQNRAAMTLRQPVGVAALITAANTPIANVAYKVFPSLLCGNASVLKAAEDAPATAWAFADLAREVGIPRGVLNVVQGLGEEAGAPLVEDGTVRLVSFTGSPEVGKRIQRMAAERSAKVCLELGGKNALVVCDDADLDEAARWASLSAFSNAGQRCAAGSRIILFDGVYDAFRARFLDRVAKLRVGTGDDCDLGPVITEKALLRMLAVIDRARATSAKILAGGRRLTDETRRDGFFLEPTVVEDAAPGDEISTSELFGPITCFYRARDFEHAVEMANGTPFGLTAAIHTRSIHRAQQFIQVAVAGMVVVNGGTFGNEPHMPFGGLRHSGNGWRDTGTEALDVYSDWKTVYVVHDPKGV